MPKRLIFVLQFLVFCSFYTPSSIYSQVKYGNEWINYSQTYYKIPVSVDGIYRLSHSLLNNAGVLNGNPDPRNFHLYHKGIEIPIRISGEQDGKFDPTDFIDFWGKKNDGSLDRALYPSSAAQPNPDISLFSDQSAYYLTINSLPGKRYQEEANTSSDTPEPFIISNTRINWTEAYYPGAYIISTMSLSEYINAEGYSGAGFGKGEVRNVRITSDKLLTNTNYPIRLETYFSGISNAVSNSPTGKNHHIKIEVGNNGTNYQPLFDTTFTGYDGIRKNLTISPSLAGNQTFFNFSSVDDLGAVTDFQSLAYVSLTFPRSTDLSGQNGIVFKQANTSPIQKFQFTNTTWQNPVILDSLNSRIFRGTIASTQATFVINQTNGGLYLYNDNSALNPASIEKVVFNNLSATGFNSSLLLITHSSLLAAGTDYKTYKQSRGMKTELVTTDELYNQFNYGIHSPIAIRNYISYLLQNAPTKPKYLLLLGKGRSFVRFNLAEDLVPTMGFPASDVAFSSEIIDNSLTPALATGRIPAKNNQEALAYLNKLKAFDNQTADSLWRKNIIHTNGGKTQSENLAFITYEKGFAGFATGEHFGAKIKAFEKVVTDPITDNLTPKLISEVNKGAALLTFFGHGSSSSTEINFGAASELNNANKLLFYLVDGCSTGDAFNSVSLGESNILYPSTGAIGWVGTTSLGVASYLANFTTQFYRNSFVSNYGKSVAENISNTIKTYQNPSDHINRAHSRQYIYFGDPTIGFYAPQKPDYEITNNDVYVTTSNVTSTSNSFELALIVKNIGKAVKQDLKVALTRMLPDNSVVTYNPKDFAPVYNTDTLYFTVPNNIPNTAGLNKLTIVLDAQNAVDELNELNNSATFSYSIQSSGALILSPLPYSILNSSTPIEIVAQNSDLLAKNSEFLFEIDTLISFTTNFKKTATITSPGINAIWKPVFNPEAGKVYYFRTRLSANTGWETSSFTYLPTSSLGWNQSHKQQFDKINLRNIVFQNDRFDFVKTAFVTSIRTRGDDAPTTSERVYRSFNNDRISFYNTEFSGISIVALDTLQPGKNINYPHPNNYDGSGQYYFNINNPAEADSLANFLNRVPSGYYVIGYNGRNTSFKNLPQKLSDAFSTLGLVQFKQIDTGEPYAFWSKKGQFGFAVEKTADYTSPTPARQQEVFHIFEFKYPFTTGELTSEKIGPAKSWDNVNFDFRKDADDIISYNIIGVTEAGTETSLISNSTQQSISLSNINASAYPFLKIKATLTDEQNRTAAQLKQWTVLYQRVPEVYLNPEVNYSFYADQLAEGDTIKLNVTATNQTAISTDSIAVRYQLTKADRSQVTDLVKKIKLPSKGSELIRFTLPTIGLSGSNFLRLFLEPGIQDDTNPGNNSLQLPFTVAKDIKPPVIDVLFDGKRIINSEIVSPNPVITIRLTDENPFIMLSDTSNLELFIKKGEEPGFKRIYYSAGKISFIPANSKGNSAQIIYRPEAFSDGLYTLKLRGKDNTGNYILANDYQIDFEVINKQTITNFYPYPNPFTTQMRFVFTVTGNSPPEKLKVQILTVTGKIVREVLKPEFGNINIGNNISEFAWDGTDQFGDRLANGVYFYRVITENTDQTSPEHRGTAADGTFKNSFGKIYLMR